MTGDRLTDWLAPYTVGAPQREAAIRAAGEDLRASPVRELLDLVLLAVELPAPAAMARVGAAVAAHDDTFEATSTAQVRVAAAWALHLVLEGVSDEDRLSASAVGLGLQAAVSSGSSPVEDGLAAAADQAVMAASEDDRQREPLPLPNKTKAFAGIAFADEAPVTGADLTRVLNAAQTAITTAQTSITRLSAAAEARVLADDEEIQVLWWSFTERRGGDGQSWADLGAAAGILAGLDLACLMAYDSPIGSAGALLQRALADVAPVDLAAAAAAAAPHLDADDVTGDHALLPIHRAVHAAQAPGGDATVTPAGAEVSQTELAERALREAMLRRHLV